MSGRLRLTDTAHNSGRPLHSKPVTLRVKCATGPFLVSVFTIDLTSGCIDIAVGIVKAIADAVEKRINKH